MPPANATFSGVGSANANENSRHQATSDTKLSRERRTRTGDTGPTWSIAPELTCHGGTLVHPSHFGGWQENTKLIEKLFTVLAIFLGSTQYFALDLPS